MKKILVTSLLAMGVIAISQQEASAWLNSRFSIGLNYDLQSANNSVLWGLWRNGQIPGPEMGGGGFGGGYGAPYGAPPYAPRYGGAQPGYTPQPMPPVNTGAMIPQGGQGGYFEPGFADQPMNNGTASANYYSPYRFANYPRQSYYYYPSTYYYYGQ